MILRQQDFRRVTNHASRGQEVRDEAPVRDRAPQTARSGYAVPSSVTPCLAWKVSQMTCSAIRLKGHSGGKNRISANCVVCV